MSLRLQPPPPPSLYVSDDSEGDDEEEEEEEEEETWEDWVSDSMSKSGCRSLFDDTTLMGAEDAVRYDRERYGFDLGEACGRLGLDVHGRIRLINFIRKTRATPRNVETLTGNESFFSSDDYLIPTIENDPLILIQTDDWSDDDDDDDSAAHDSDPPSKHIAALQSKLLQAKKDLEEYRTLVSKKLDLLEEVNLPPPPPDPRDDDDTHYFNSYAENDIHAVMIQDKVRTSTYAQFILTNSALFRDAVVLDVGCGTGILSLFAARAGAKKVYAVDASDIAIKAREIVKLNGAEDVISVIQGKVEDIVLPDEKEVDVIVSEWMGYALLYESMLDSVLVARDRFLRKDGLGVVAPSECKMMLGLCDASEILKERVEFWGDVYGFDLSPMASELYDDAIIDVLGPNTLLSDPCVVKDIHISTVTSRNLDFSTPFSLVSTAERRTKVTAFVLYFDTFFTPSGRPVSASTNVHIIKEDEAHLAEVWPVGGKPAPQRRASHVEGKELPERVTSFSTGPQSMPTHWKQTIFLLREPIRVEEGTVVEGTFYCRKSEMNSRELDVEIHYTTRAPVPAGGCGGEGELVVQMYKVR